MAVYDDALILTVPYARLMRLGVTLEAVLLDLLAIVRGRSARNSTPRSSSSIMPRLPGSMTTWCSSGTAMRDKRLNGEKFHSPREARILIE